MTATPKPLEVLVLDGRDVPNPEDMAMLQALYSRSPAPVKDHLKKVADLGSTQFMGRYYVQYGHRSIGDNGHATVFIENVSMLMAKAVQDNQLYNGQECSTRYLDFSTQPFLIPTDLPPEAVPIFQGIQEEWRALYLEALPMVHDWAKRTYTPADVVSSKVPADKVLSTWEATTKAIAFDIVRSLLPCGAATSVAWTTNFSVGGDHLADLASHPLEEVRLGAQVIHAALKAKEPNSFRDLPPSEVGSIDDYYLIDYSPEDDVSVKEYDFKQATRTEIQEANEPKAYKRRSFVDNSSIFVIQGVLDFGSFRDLQRHRNGYMGMPIVDGQIGFSDWYKGRLTEACGEGFMAKVMILISKVRATKAGTMKNNFQLRKQYIYPMGMMVPVEMHWGPGQVKYVLGLRSKTSVHPTLREFMWKLYDSIITRPKSAKWAAVAGIEGSTGYFSVDRSPHYLASDRGNQTITEKPSV